MEQRWGGEFLRGLEMWISVWEVLGFGEGFDVGVESQGRQQILELGETPGSGEAMSGIGRVKI